MVNVRPQIVREPARDEPSALGAIEYLTVPLPLPVLPEVTVIQELSLFAVHSQPLEEDTETEPVPRPR